MASKFEGGLPGKRWDDSSLVRRALRGDASSWHELVERYSAYIYTLLRSARVPEGDQPDAFQYVFVELFKAMPKLERTDYLAPWIRQTTIRHAVRLRGKLSTLEQMPEDDLVSPDSVEDDYAQSERALMVREAVQSLKDQCRTLIRLLFFAEEPLPYSQVAEKLGIAVGSIGQTRQRCLDALQKALTSRGLG